MKGRRVTSTVSVIRLRRFLKQGLWKGNHHIPCYMLTAPGVGHTANFFGIIVHVGQFLSFWNKQLDGVVPLFPDFGASSNTIKRR